MTRNLNSICGFCHLVLLRLSTLGPQCVEDAEWKQQQNQSILHTHRHLTGVQPGTQGLLITKEPTPKDRHETTHSMWSSLITKEKQQTQKILNQWPFCPQSQHTCIVPSKIWTTHSPRSVPVVSSLFSWPLNQWCRTLFFSGENLCGLNVPLVKQGNRRTQNCLPALPEKNKTKQNMKVKHLLHCTYQRNTTNPKGHH